MDTVNGESIYARPITISKGILPTSQKCLYESQNAIQQWREQQRVAQIDCRMKNKVINELKTLSSTLIQNNKTLTECAQYAGYYAQAPTTAPTEAADLANASRSIAKAQTTLLLHSLFITQQPPLIVSSKIQVQIRWPLYSGAPCKIACYDLDDESAEQLRKSQIKLSEALQHRKVMGQGTLTSVEEGQTYGCDLPNMVCTNMMNRRHKSPKAQNAMDAYILKKYYLLVVCTTPTNDCYYSLSLPFAYQTHWSQNEKLLPYIFWHMAFSTVNNPTADSECGSKSAWSRKKVPWSEFSAMLEALFYNQINQSAPGSDQKRSLSPEDLKYLKQHCNATANQYNLDGISCADLVEAKFLRVSSSNEPTLCNFTFWSWLYSIIKMLQSNTGPWSSRPNELRKFWDTHRVWGFLSKLDAAQMLQRWSRGGTGRLQTGLIIRFSESVEEAITLSCINSAGKVTDLLPIMHTQLTDERFSLIQFLRACCVQMKIEKLLPFPFPNARTITIEELCNEARAFCQDQVDAGKLENYYMHWTMELKLCHRRNAQLQQRPSASNTPDSLNQDSVRNCDTASSSISGIGSIDQDRAFSASPADNELSADNCFDPSEQQQQAKFPNLTWDLIQSALQDTDHKPFNSDISSL